MLQDGQAVYIKQEFWELPAWETALALALVVEVDSSLHIVVRIPEEGAQLPIGHI